MRKLFIILILLSSSQKAFLQTIDTARIILNSKVLLIEDLKAYEDVNYYKTFLDYSPKYTFLQSSGFEGRFIFYKILERDTTLIRVRIDSNKILLKPFFLLKNEPVFFAFDLINHKIYRLSGMKCNDYETFKKDVIIYRTIDEGKNFNKLLFKKQYYIEGFKLK